jgi:hypothetical protein
MSPRTERWLPLALAFLWLLVQAGLWAAYGTFSGLEAEKYTAAAKHLLETGSFPERKYLFYALTPLLIAGCLKLGIGYHGVVVIQLLLNAGATCLFYRTIRDIAGSRAAFAGTAALVLFLPYQSWNVYLYTESLYLSALLLFFFTVQRLAAEPRRAERIAMSVGALVLVIMARPFGMLFLPPFLLLVFWMLPQRWRWASLLFGFAGGGLLYYALNRAFSGSMDWNALVPQVKGEVICDMPDPRYQQPLRLLPGGNPVDQLAYYIVHNPAHYARLSLLRLKAFVLWTRPWYSTMHNAALIGYMLVFYGGFILGIGRLRRYTSRPFFAFVVSALIVYALAITLQCDDYHSRFVMALVPLLILAGTAALKPRAPQTYQN